MVSARLGQRRHQTEFNRRQEGRKAEFYTPDLRLIPPVRLEPHVWEFLAKRAEAKGTTLNALLNA